MNGRRLDSVMMHVLLRPLVAMLQLFGVYVLMHGHYSPGGGFQAGVLLASSMLLPIVVHGDDPPRFLVIRERGAAVMASAGVLLATVVGAVPLALGRPFLDYAALPLGLEPAAARSLGILLLEVGITLGVMGVILSIYYSLHEEDVAA